MVGPIFHYSKEGVPTLLGRVWPNLMWSCLYPTQSRPVFRCTWHRIPPWDITPRLSPRTISSRGQGVSSFLLQQQNRFLLPTHLRKRRHHRPSRTLGHVWVGSSLFGGLDSDVLPWFELAREKVGATIDSTASERFSWGSINILIGMGLNIPQWM